MDPIAQTLTALTDLNGNAFSFDGTKKTVVYFYSKDHTSGCTLQALKYEELLSSFEKEGARVVGISKDSTVSHLKFAEKIGIHFTLLSDPERTAAEAFDVLKPKRSAGETSLKTVRSSFLISESGEILCRRYGVKADKDAQEMLEILKEENSE